MQTREPEAGAQAQIVVDEDRPYGPRTLGATTDSLAPPMASPAVAVAHEASHLPSSPARPVQRRAADDRPALDPITASVGATPAPRAGTVEWSVAGDGRLAVQRRGGADVGPAAVQAAAEAGISGAAGALPHREAIQASFGRHDVSQVQAHTDAAAGAGARAMGAEAFATGDHVAFAAPPSLHTAAHEAAHVVQQRAGVQLLGGVGEVGDRYERNADDVADRVVRGESAESLLDDIRGGGGARSAVQRKGGTGGDSDTGGDDKDKDKHEGGDGDKVDDKGGDGHKVGHEGGELDKVEGKVGDGDKGEKVEEKKPAHGITDEKTLKTLVQLLESRGLELTEFEGSKLDNLTAAKVKRALDGDPMNVKKTTPEIIEARKAAEKWALAGANRDPSEFANRYEYARARYSELKRQAEKTIKKEDIPKNSSKDKVAGNKASEEITAEKLTKALDGDMDAVNDLGEGTTKIALKDEMKPLDLAAEVQKAKRIPYQSSTAEAYHALKHAKELDGITALKATDSVPRFAEATELTLTGGSVHKAWKTETGSTCVIIRKEFDREGGDKVTLEAIVYVQEDGTLVLATFGQAKAK
ncbi:MAG TPA: DUF4157 domain-containing protein [Kofleriaceae bacterium]|nr:DUF4157 domain-containing protein [Kofleriaceae bacterium]